MSYEHEPSTSDYQLLSNEIKKNMSSHLPEDERGQPYSMVELCTLSDIYGPTDGLMSQEAAHIQDPFKTSDDQRDWPYTKLYCTRSNAPQGSVFTLNEIVSDAAINEGRSDIYKSEPISESFVYRFPSDGVEYLDRDRRVTERKEQDSDYWRKLTKVELDALYDRFNPNKNEIFKRPKYIPKTQKKSVIENDTITPETQALVDTVRRVGQQIGRKIISMLKDPKDSQA